MRSLVFQITSILFIGAFTPSVDAQISPDNTLRNNSIVNQVDQEWQINGGETVGNNLFHSFSQFNVGIGETAYFLNNETAIANIITRVTGSNISNVDGIIKADGTANLFLINPNGIIFSSNAKLNIGGSFRGQTIWQDLQDFSLPTQGENTTAENPQTVMSNMEGDNRLSDGDSFARQRHPSSSITEATGWVRDEQGKVTLIAAVPNRSTSGNLTKPPNCLLKGKGEGGRGNRQN